MIYQRLAKVFLICSSECQWQINVKGEGEDPGMDRTQAAEIQRHMRRAANAINRASEIIFALDEEDREVLGTPLQEIIKALHFKLLHAVYIRYPELRPPDPGRSRIDTARRWKDIVLPESVSETDLDSIIFSAPSSRWQKTAMVISKALKQCERLALPVDAEVVGVRTRALAEAGRLEGQGDLRKWGYSEVRLNAEERRDL
jgi:hypothetical protein